MRNSFKIIFALSGMTLFINTTYATKNLPNNDHPTIFLGPNLKGHVTAPLCDSTAFSILGEAGWKNFRAGGTLGWKFLSNQRFKASVDYLRQDLTYSYFNGNSNQWVSQWSFSAAYEYDFAECYFRPQFDLAAYYSHAPSQTLDTRFGFFFNQFDLLQEFSDQRRIAGSRAWGILPSLSVEPWCGGRLGAIINYDNVRYNTSLDSSENGIAFGTTVFLDQWLTECIDAGLAVAWRSPYNNYSARIGLINIPYLRSLRLGVEAVYTVGKHTLPNTYDVSLTADYFYDPCPCPPPVLNCRGEIMPPVIVTDRKFLKWTANPAHYHPQVLAIPDERVTFTTLTPLPPFFAT